MQLPPTFEDVSRIVKLLSRLQTKIKTRKDGYKNAGQRRVAIILCKYSQVILQMYRRSGKSYIVSIIAAIYIICGETVIIGAPTQGQSSRIIYKEITEIVDILFKLAGGVKKVRDSLTYNVWANGGTLLALTANIASKQQEGYGGAFLILDEGQRLDPAILAIMTPCIDDAMEMGIGKKVVLGVGGLMTTLIEYLKGKKGWVSYKYRASDETIPSKQGTFKDARATNTQTRYDAHYECKAVREGTRKCFPVITDKADTDIRISQGLRKIYYFGIDVGKKDETVVVVTERVGDKANIVDHFNMSGPDHIPIAAAVFEFIDRYMWTPERIIIEQNNPGTYLQDTLLKNHGMATNLSVTHEGFSDAIWHSSNVALRDGRLGCPDPLMYEKLDQMTYEIKLNGHMKFEHCDYYSAFTMVYSAMLNSGFEPLVDA